MHLLLLSCLQLTIILKPKWHIWGCVLCYPSEVHELILFKRTQPCVWYRRGALCEYASSCIREHLACEFSELHPLSPESNCFGSKQFSNRGLQVGSYKTKLVDVGRKCLSYSLFSFILYLIKIKNQNKRVQKTTQLLLASASSSFLSGSH